MFELPQRFASIPFALEQQTVIQHRALHPLNVLMGFADGNLSVGVTDPEGALLPGAEVRIISVVEGRTYVAATARSDDSGKMSHTTLPRGEAWVLVEAPGRQRASVRVFLGPSPLAIEVVLRPARALVVGV